MRIRTFGALLALVVLAGCGSQAASSSDSQSTAASTSAAALPSVRLGYAGGAAPDLADGFVDATTTAYPTTAALATAVKQGRVDVGVFGGDVTRYAVEGAGTIVFVDFVDRGAEVLAQPGAEIAKLAQIKGEKVAVTPGSAGDILLDRALRRIGLSRADVRLVRLPADAAVRAYAGGRVAAMGADSAQVQQLQTDAPGGGVLATAKKDQGAAVPHGWIASSGWLASHRDAMTALVRAVEHGQIGIPAGTPGSWRAAILATDQNLRALHLVTGPPPSRLVDFSSVTAASQN